MKITQKPALYFEDNGFHFPARELYDLLADLEDTDPFFSAIVIFDSRLQDYLSNQKVIKRNVRGACYKGTNYVEFTEQIRQLLVAFSKTGE